MIIWNDYTTDELAMDLPCEHMEIGNIYPVRIKDFKEFSKYIYLLKITKEKLQIEDSELSDLSIAILGYTKVHTDELGLEFEDAYKLTVDNFIELIKIVTHKIFELGSIGDEIAFICEEDDRTFEISESNFSDFRDIVLKQNVVVEEKEYKDKVVNKWLKKARKAHSKDGGIEFAEMLAVVKNHTGITYRDLAMENIFQLQLDFKTVVLNKSYDTSILFKTVTDKVESVDYTKLNIEEMFEVKEYLTSASSVLGKMS
ncbi:MAG: hypothetical protein ACRCX8_18975 [Sarcina sp.]